MQAALFTVWNMSGGPVEETAVSRIERAITRIIESIEQNEGVRLVTQTTRAEADGE